MAADARCRVPQFAGSVGHRHCAAMTSLVPDDWPSSSWRIEAGPVQPQPRTLTPSEKCPRLALLGIAVLTGYMDSSARERTDGFPLEALRDAVRASWSLETCDPTDAAEWTPANPSRGQCAVTALVVHDLFGGQLLEAEVHFRDGSRQGFHYWNRLARGDVDLTREQFSNHELLQEPRVVDRLPEFPWRAQEQYLIFRRRVYAALKMPPPEGC